jgi:AcrR family transcriptional regulator
VSLLVSIESPKDSVTLSRASEAVQRAMAERHREATEEVERILAATVEVMERVAPAAPRLTDIIAEAGTSNKAFYRYFSGKDDLILAVMERGVALVASYLEHRMAKADDPDTQLAEWIGGVLAQAADPKAARASRAVTTQFALVAPRGTVDEDITTRLRDLLVDPITRAGSGDPQRDADVIFEAVFGTMRRHLSLGTRPTRRDTDHLVAFCQNAVQAWSQKRSSNGRS